MRLATLFTLMIVLLGCMSSPSSSPSGSSPPLRLPPDNLCRCRGLRNTLALVHVEGDPVPFRDQRTSLETDWVSGVEFTLIVEQTYVPPGQPADETAPPMRIRARQTLNGPGGAAWPAGDLNAVAVRRDQRMFVLLYPYWTDRRYWSLEIQPFNASTNTLGRRWYQFPAGTPITQVLAPTEWNDPSRGCDGSCTSPALGSVDAGPDAPSSD